MKVKAIIDKFSGLQAQAIPTTTKIRKALEKGKSVEIDDVLANKLIGWNIIKKVIINQEDKKELECKVRYKRRNNIWNIVR